MLPEIFSLYKDIITDYEIQSFCVEKGSYELIAVLTFLDSSELYVKEYLFRDNTRKYAYHWQTSKGKLIVRWDNARHWESIHTYPHHKHYKKVKVVQPSEEHTLEQVIEVINKELKK